MTVHDPLHRLVVSEAFRFVGTVGDISSERTVLNVYCAIVAQLQHREVKSQIELLAAVNSLKEREKEWDAKVIKHTLEVADALNLLSSIPTTSGKVKKYTIGEHGRILNAMTIYDGWDKPNHRAILFLRPMFEANGDYLVQAMEAFDSGGSRSDILERFRQLVRELADSKVREIENTGSGVKWDTYRRSLETRRTMIRGETVTSEKHHPSLADLQKVRQKSFDAVRRRKAEVASTIASQAETSLGEPKTLEHHLSRCRSWLVALGLMAASNDNRLALSKKGRRLKDYFDGATGHKRPSRIPPSLATLQDCFRLTTEEVSERWGAVVDDAFWENALLSLYDYGTYCPSPVEIHKRFHEAFNRVRVSGISEANIMSLRCVLFYRWLWEGKPVEASLMDDIMAGANAIPRSYPNEFGYGRNRQGRLAYIFRKIER